MVSTKHRKLRRYTIGAGPQAFAPAEVSACAQLLGTGVEGVPGGPVRFFLITGIKKPFFAQLENHIKNVLLSFAQDFSFQIIAVKFPQFNHSNWG